MAVGLAPWTARLDRREQKKARHENQQHEAEVDDDFVTQRLVEIHSGNSERPYNIWAEPLFGFEFQDSCEQQEADDFDASAGRAGTATNKHQPD